MDQKGNHGKAGSSEEVWQSTYFLIFGIPFDGPPIRLSWRRFYDDAQRFARDELLRNYDWRETIVYCEQGDVFWSCRRKGDFWREVV